MSAGDDARAAAWTVAPTLRGSHVSLQPLAAAHVDGLRAALAGDALSRLWYANVPSAAQAEDYVRKALDRHAQGLELPFAVLDGAGDVVGSTRFYDLAPDVPRLNIGYTWYAPHVQRSGVNTQAKRLLLGHAFEAMGCIAVGFETSWFNHASRVAIARLGARQDGVLRHHKRHADGSVRDTVAFSILDREWPAVKRTLQEKLDRDRGQDARHD